MNPDLDKLHQSYGRTEGEDPAEYARLAEQLKASGNLQAAATAYDRAYGQAPQAMDIQRARQELLDQLAIREHGIVFRYIPAGTFQMGSDKGDADEAPTHPVRLDACWISETPVSWASFCSVMGWSAPPQGLPPQQLPPQEPVKSKEEGFWAKTINRVLQRPTDSKPKGEPVALNRDEIIRVSMYNLLRLQYCEDATTRAIDWHAHAPEQQWTRGGKPVSSHELFGKPPRENPDQPWAYAEKPMISVSWHEAQALCAKLSNPDTLYSLPTEAEWEKAARGGLIGCPYPWGAERPSRNTCDFDRFDQFSILPMKTFAPNGYGLYAMSGGVWEWTADWYDAKSYATSPIRNPAGPEQGQEKVIRGGSWADCAEVVTVAFRMSQLVRGPDCGGAGTPNIGFRICRKARGV